jgi:hypothetical protein
MTRCANINVDFQVSKSKVTSCLQRNITTTAKTLQKRVLIKYLTKKE